MTTVVNMQFKNYDVYIGRAGRGEDGYFGNPFTTGSSGGRREAIARFKTYFLERIDKDAEFKTRVLALKGKQLGCFCKPKACHGDVIAEWLNQEG